MYVCEDNEDNHNLDRNQWNNDDYDHVTYTKEIVFPY